MTENGSTLTVETVRLDWDLIEQRCAELGANTSAERAELLHFGRASLYRWRDGGEISLSRADAIAVRLGLDLADIVTRRPPNPPSSPPPQPRPPAGPPKPPTGPRPPKGGNS